MSESDPVLRATTLQVFYRKNIQLAPYNNAEVGLILTLEALPGAVVTPQQLGEALHPFWEGMQEFVHGQEDTAHTRYAEMLPDDQRPYRPGLAQATRFKAVAEESRGDPPLLEAPRTRRPPQPAAAAVPESEPPFPVRPPQPAAAAVPESEPPFPTRRAAPPEEEQTSEEREAQERADRADPGELTGDDEPASTPGPGDEEPQGAPATGAEARSRYFRRYGEALGGDSFYYVRRFFVEPQMAEPGTTNEDIEAWVQLAYRTRDEIAARAQRISQARTALKIGEQKAAEKAPARPQRRTPAATK